MRDPDAFPATVDLLQNRDEEVEIEGARKEKSGAYGLYVRSFDDRVTPQFGPAVGSARGLLQLVLHAHLPFVRHPEHAYALEENWLYEAVVDTYLPLLAMLERLARDGVPHAITISLSPTLCSMLEDPLLQSRTSAYLDRLLVLCEREQVRTRGDAQLHDLALFYTQHYRALHDLFHAYGGRLIPAFRRLQDAGQVELITTAFTHPFLPFVAEPAVRKAHIALAGQQHTALFGKPPKGLWLPECAYEENLAPLLAAQGVEYTFLESHGILGTAPCPPLGVDAPVYHPAGVTFFGRDPASSRQVWSATDGYPGDPWYRDFYRDVGFDLPLAEVLPFIHPDGIRVQTGLKYHRVTGPHVDLAHKALYQPDIARQRALEHARHFVHSRLDHARQHAAGAEGRPAVITALYDAELFGHWWFEGPWFLEQVCRELAAHANELVLRTPSTTIQHAPRFVARPVASTWGAGGYAETWLNGTNDWVYPLSQQAEKTLLHWVRAQQWRTDPLAERVLQQMARELFLLQGSDWAFLMTTGTSAEYAAQRVQTHHQRFLQLAAFFSQGGLDEIWLQDVEKKDFLLQKLDLDIFL